MSPHIQASGLIAGLPPLLPNDLPQPDLPQPGPDTVPLPDPEPFPEQDPDLPQPGQITPPIVA